MDDISVTRTENGRLITKDEIQLIMGLDLEAARREHQYIREQLKTESKDLLLSQYCEFHGHDMWEIESYLDGHEYELD